MGDIILHDYGSLALIHQVGQHAGNGFGEPEIMIAVDFNSLAGGEFTYNPLQAAGYLDDVVHSPKVICQNVVIGGDNEKGVFRQSPVGQIY